MPVFFSENENSPSAHIGSYLYISGQRLGFYEGRALQWSNCSHGNADVYQALCLKWVWQKQPNGFGGEMYCYACILFRKNVLRLFLTDLSGTKLFLFTLQSHLRSSFNWSGFFPAQKKIYFCQTCSSYNYNRREQANPSQHKHAHVDPVLAWTVREGHRLTRPAGVIFSLSLELTLRSFMWV